MKTIKLTDLKGEHLLTGVDLYNAQIKESYGETFIDASHISFCLDGITYTAIEDPSDGYRSALGEIGVSDYVLRNTFPPVRVLGIYKEKEGMDDCDILQLFNAISGNLVLEIGTDNTDDYYPSFVSSFDPKGLLV